MKSKQEKLSSLFIEQVPKYGWSRDTLLHCAKKLRISTPNLALMFPSFEYDVLKFLISQNNDLVTKNYNSFNNSRLNTRDKIKTILELKFDSNEYLKKALPEMLKFLLRPGNIFMSIKILHENLVEKGKTSVNIEFYHDNNIYSFELLNKRKIDRKLLNDLKNKEISSKIN